MKLFHRSRLISFELHRAYWPAIGDYHCCFALAALTLAFARLNI